MSEHPIADQIIAELNKHGFWYESFAHEHVRTSEEAAAMRDGYTLAEGSKALIVRVKVRGEGKAFAMVVLPGDKKFSSSKVKAALNANDLRFASEEEVASITNGVKPGGVPPFGNLFNLRVVVDKGVLAKEKMVFNAGRNYSIGIHTADYKELLNPIIAEITD